MIFEISLAFTRVQFERIIFQISMISVNLLLLLELLCSYSFIIIITEKRTKCNSSAIIIIGLIPWYVVPLVVLLSSFTQ